MPRQIHAVVQDAQHLDHAVLLMGAKDQQMPPLAALPSHMEAGNIRSQLWPCPTTHDTRAGCERF